MVSLILSLALTHVLGDKATVVFIPPVYTYLLPAPFQGYETVGGNSSTHFVNTVTANASINTLFSAAKNAAYYVFDEEFNAILGGKTPDIQLIATRPSLFASEAGAWDYDLNQTSPPPRNINPNGGNYFNGTMYLTLDGNLTLPNGAPAIYAIDTKTHDATAILNSSYGLKCQSVDDLSWVKPVHTSCVNTGPTLSSTTLDLRPFDEDGTAPQTQQDNVYRYSPNSQPVQGVISRADIVSPNGVRTDATGQYFYVTGTAAPFTTIANQTNPFLSDIIYRYTLDGDCFPVNKRLIATVRSYADGLPIDDYGRIWTGEWDGITVRRPDGKVVGRFQCGSAGSRESVAAEC